MAVYIYKAWSSTAAPARGTITADTPAAAREQLRHAGLRVADLRPLRESVIRPRWSAVSRHREDAVTEIYSELATLLGAGIVLLEAIETVAAQRSSKMVRQCLHLLRDRIAAGSTLAGAMRQQPQWFDALSAAVVEVGERTGQLDQVLEQLAEFRQRASDWRGRVATAFIYPSIVVITGMTVTMFLTTFVVPRLLEALTEAGRPLPLPTRMVKLISDGLVHHGWAGLLIVACVAVVVWVIGSRPASRRKWHRLVLRLPIIGDLVLKQQLTQVAFTLSTLTRNGIPFVEALRIVHPTIANTALRDGLVEVEQAVSCGRDIGPAMAQARVFPGTMVQVFAVSQATGRLDEMLARLGRDYDRQVNRTIQRMIAMLEPVMILLLAGLVGFIVLAVILPYMDAGNVL